MGRGGDGTGPVLRSRVLPTPALVEDAALLDTKAAGGRLPTAPPPFTLAQLRAAVPPHCFKRSLLRSSAYLAADCAGAVALYLAVRAADALPMPPAARLLLWTLYVLAQGAVCTGIWVIAHECGHGAFSDYPVVNDSVGLVFHSALLVPYFSWKFSHARHHAGTGSLERDEVFVPASKAQHDAAHVAEGIMATGPGRVVLLAATLLVGWPLYLVRNAGSRKYAGRHADHFWPWSPVFKSRRERALVALSDAALLLAAAVLHRAVGAHGLAWVAKSYFAPYLMVNFWLVMITLLQHTHPSLPHFGGAEWEWLRGACCTVDRTYGALLNTLHHHIADTHVCHHIFSGMPHYHAQEATAALAAVMGPYLVSDKRNIFAALLADWRQCVYVDADEGGNKEVLWFRSMDGAHAKLVK